MIISLTFNVNRSLMDPLHKAAFKYLPKQIIDTSVIRMTGVL